MRDCLTKGTFFYPPVGEMWNQWQHISGKPWQPTISLDGDGIIQIWMYYICKKLLRRRPIITTWQERTIIEGITNAKWLQLSLKKPENNCLRLKQFRCRHVREEVRWNRFHLNERGIDYWALHNDINSTHNGNVKRLSVTRIWVTNYFPCIDRPHVRKR